MILLVPNSACLYGCMTAGLRRGDYERGVGREG